MEDSDTGHQHAMLEEILQLMDLNEGFGLLDPMAFTKSAEIIGEGSGEISSISNAAKGAWSHSIWRRAKIGGPQQGPLGPAGRQTFAALVASPWFYGLDLFGTAAFAISGFIRHSSAAMTSWVALFSLCYLP